uniref:non-specific serine/threonine protein kinase n=1 Tax=Cannabis sativa TaxID=3483 RepID=A0A803NU41_CANSA
MGNKIARTTQVSASEYYLHDLPSSYNLVLKEVLGRGRFLKSILCKHDEGLVLVKVYFKRGDNIDLREYERRLFHIKETLRGLEFPHVWPFQFWQETDKAAYLLRQYFFNNLHDRLSTRPFLSLVEKRWLAFQLLLAVKQCHEKGVCHGDIKCENVLVTSWNWLYLVDFASFKPTYIPYDDPSDFSFFFDTGGRRLCYLAPERFYEHGGEMQVAQDAPLRPSMDIFAVGCVIAELFLEGQPLFELSQLLAYRRGQYDPSQLLEKLEPESRLSAANYLQDYMTIVFPSYFSPFLHNFFCFWNPLNSDMRVVLCQSFFHEILKQMMSTRSTEGNGTGLAMIPKENTESGIQSEEMIAKQNPTLEKESSLKRDEIDKGLNSEHIETLGDINSLLRDVKKSNHYSGNKPILEDVHSSELSQNFRNYGMQSPGELLQTISSAFRRNDHPFMKKITLNDLNLLMSKHDSQTDTFDVPFLPLPEDGMTCEGMVLITSLLCSCIRNVKLPHLRRRAILFLKCSALYIDDEDRLQRVLPYVIAMLSDSAAIVRCAALETLCDILPLVRDFPPSDAKIFPEYILPMLSMLPDDPEESVRICYASNIAQLALTAYGFLIHSISLSEAGVLDEQKPIQSSSRSSGRLQRANSDAQLAQLRKSIAEVVQELVMGPKQTPNIRRALLQDISNLCCFFGQRQSNDFLLPILPAFLNDRDEQLRTVFYGQIVYVCFFVGQRSVEEYLLPYIEQALIDTTEAVIVNALDCLAILCKSSFLRKRILLEMIERAFPLICYPSQWVRRSSDMLERQRKIWYNSSPQSKQWETLDLLQKVVADFNPAKSWPDKQQNYESSMPAFNSMQQAERSEYDDGEAKLRTMGSLIHNSSSAVELYDPLSSEKLQFSGFMMPQGSGVNSFMGDKPSEGIPLYSFSMDKRAAGNPSAASDSLLQVNSGGFGASSLPWMDPSNKSFSLASSVPAPKLVSGSFSISSGSKQFYRVVHEPDGRENDQTSYVSTKFQDMGLSSSAKGGSVPLEVASSQTELTGLPSFTRTSSISDSGWRPRGVWDSRKLEKDISFRSRLTYHLEGSRALCATMLRGSAQVVVGACDGMIHIFSVDYITRGLGNVVEKYSGIADIKKKDIKEGAILSLLNHSTDNTASQTVMYSTQNCGIHLWDTRTSSNSWTLNSVPENGYVSSLVTGPCGNWFVSGSSRGELTLWDLRFLIPVNSWQYPLVCPIEKMCLFVPPPNASTSTAVRPLSMLLQVLKVANYDSDAEMSDILWALGKPLSRGNSKPDVRRNVNPKYRVNELQEPPPRLPGIRSLIPLPGGDLLTGGTDLKIRRWDHCSPDRSYSVCGPNGNEVVNDEFFKTSSNFGAQIVQEKKRRLPSAVEMELSRSGSE